MTPIKDRPIPIIDLHQCDGCGLCVRACPTKALSLQDGKAIVAIPLVCEYNGLCETVCPIQAISRLFEIVFSDQEKTSSNSTKVVEKDRAHAYNSIKPKDPTFRR